MKIDRFMNESGGSDYYNPDFRKTLEAHVPYFRTASSSYRIPVTPINLVVYNQDLFGFLTEMKIKQNLHWLIMRINNYFSPFDFKEGAGELISPSEQELEQIRQAWKTTSIIRT